MFGHFSHSEFSLIAIRLGLALYFMIALMTGLDTNGNNGLNTFQNFLLSQRFFSLELLKVFSYFFAKVLHINLFA